MKTSQSYPPMVVDTSVEQAVTHEAIEKRARELWIEADCPENCDEAIWLEAEAELRAIQKKVYRHPCVISPPQLKEGSPSRPKPVNVSRPPLVW